MGAPTRRRARVQPVWMSTRQSRATLARRGGYCRNSYANLAWLRLPESELAVRSRRERAAATRYRERYRISVSVTSSADSYRLRRLTFGRAAARATNRGIQFAAVDEDRRRQVEKHQRDHDRREARVVGYVGVGKLGEVAAECEAAGEPQQQGGDDAGQDRAKPPPARRKPLMRNHQRNDERQARDRITREGEIPFKRLQPGGDLDRGCEQQRTEHDQERKRKQRHRPDQHIGNRLEPQQQPVARLYRPVGAIERDAQAFDAARGEIDREHKPDGENVATRPGEHVVNFRCDWVGDLAWPGFE